MNIWTHKYKLQPKLALNGVSGGGPREGCLLKVQFEDGLVGYSDVFPWVELGDVALWDQLWGLKTGEYSDLIHQSLKLARWDAEARVEDRCVSVDALSQIKNHYLISDICRFDLVQLIEVADLGFKTIKVKMGRELLRETMKLEELVDCFEGAFKLRLDFNCSINFEEFEAWIPSMTPELKKHLDFIEDPFPYNGDFWQAIAEVFGVRLALDMAADPLATKAYGADVVVLKPAKQNVLRIIKELEKENKEFVITHYMDHPVGRMGAMATANEAQFLAGEKLLDCGLNDFGLYEENSFSHGMTKIQPQSLFSQSGPGIGFDQLLSETEWTQWI